MANFEQPSGNSMAPPTDTTDLPPQVFSSTSSGGGDDGDKLHHHSSSPVDSHHHKSTVITTTVHSHSTHQPLHVKATDQTPRNSIMPPSARLLIRHSAQPQIHRRSSGKIQCQSSLSDECITSPIAGTFKCTPMTVQMTPDYDILPEDPVGCSSSCGNGAVPKQLCPLLSSEATLDASSTEAADSSKSSEYEISDDLLLQFGRHHPNHPSLIIETPHATAASRTLFSRRNEDGIDVDDTNHHPIHDENHDDSYGHDDEDDNNSNNKYDHEHHNVHNFSDILLESTTSSTPYDTPNHSSIATTTSTSPNSLDRATAAAYHSDGNVSPIHSSPPTHTQSPRRSLNFRLSHPSPIVHCSESDTYETTKGVVSHFHDADDYDHYTNANIDASTNTITNNGGRKQLRSRGSLRRNGPQRPKSFDRSITNSSSKKRRDRKKVGRHYKYRKNSVDFALPDQGKHDNYEDDGVDEDESFDDECFSTASEDEGVDDFTMIEDRSERSRDSSSVRMKSHPSRSSKSRTQRRKSSMTSMTKQNSWWKYVSHRLSTTQNLIWMLCFVGLTSVTMIVTMNHHMAQVAHMEEQNHLSILFNHPVTRTTRGLLLPPPKMPRPHPLIPTKVDRVTTGTPNKQSSPLIRGSKAAASSSSSSEQKDLSSPAIKIVAVPQKLSESTTARRTVNLNLNTLAQLPHENALQKLILSDHRSVTKGSSSSNDHHHSSGSHHHQQQHHHHHDHHQHSQNHKGRDEEDRHHSIPKHHSHHSKESEHDPHEHSHHHSHDNSVRLYVKAKPSRIGLRALQKVAIPEDWDDDRVQRSFHRVDPLLYGENFEITDNTILPRIVFLDGESFVPSPGERTVRRHRSEITDSTQLYSTLDSGDERIASMELRAPFVQGECVPMKEWQTTFNPSCNGMHELDLASMGDNRLEDDFHLFGMNGFWRNAWRYDSTGGHNSLTERDTVVLKTLRINHRFEDAYFENNRIDAVVLERLTASPHVINVFGFCGHSVLTEFADGKRLGELADKMAKVPLARLQIARDIANGLADVHGIDGDGNATFVHLDINPANVVSIGGTLKLNDFNIGVLRRWNTTSNTPCGIPAKYPNPQWRSPEEARLEQNLTEKVDVFSLGHIFFRLICGHEPWHKLEPGGMPPKEVLSEKVRQGILPTIPQEVMTSNDPEIVAIRDAMLRCYTYDPIERPSAREIATALQLSLNTLGADVNETKVLID